MLLSLLCVLLLGGIVAYSSLKQSQQLSEAKTALREELLTQVRKDQSSSIASAAAERITEKLAYIELRQTAILDEAKNSMERQTFVFSTVAAFFGLFTVFFGYRQLFIEDKGAEAREKHDQEMRSLVQSFQNNINTINSLIQTLEHSYDYRKEIEGKISLIQDKAITLEQHQAEGDVAFSALIDDLNRDALSAAPLGADRVALNYDENTKQMEAFVARLTVAEQRTKDAKSRLNPLCYYVRGLRNVATYQYELAVSDLEMAARRIKEDEAQGRLDYYPLDKRENLRSLLEQSLVTSSYFQGVCFKNLGKYAESRSRFEDALRRDPNHWDSRNYLLQVMFFDSSTPFQEIESKFSAAAREMDIFWKQASTEQKEHIRRSASLLKIYQGDIYHKPLVLPEFRSSYKRHQDPEKAVLCYWEAIGYQANELSHFCLAQALEQVGSSHWRSTTYAKEYEEAFKGLRRRVAGDFDSLYSVTLYYMLAICAFKLGERKASAEVFLSQARHGLKGIPTHVTCFSPLTRIRLTRTQMLEEMEEFEKIAT